MFLIEIEFLVLFIRFMVLKLINKKNSIEFHRICEYW